MENKTVLKYLNELSAQLLLPPEEKDGINTSLKAIKDKLVLSFFDDGLTEVKPFGSFDRETLLSRKVDAESDVDILIVFDEKKWEPQTYLTKLKQFANDNYSRSENYQDHPTIAIELNHIKFELTPCIHKAENFWENEKYLIPKKESKDIQWIKTEPNYLKAKIDKYVKTKETLLKLILIFKYWNLKNQFVFKTFEVENFVVEYFDYEEEIDYNFFRMIDKLSNSNPKAEQNALNMKTKTHKNHLVTIIENNMGEDHLLLELKKILPELL